MTHEDRQRIIDSFKQDRDIVDAGVMDFAALVAGRLAEAYEKRGSTYWDAKILRKLKKELQDFNMTTGAFK